MRIYVPQSIIRAIFVLSLFCLPQCGYYKPSKLLTPPTEGLVRKIGGVEVKVKALRDFECAHYFDYRLVSRGVQPVQLYIKNNTSNAFTFTGEQISAPILGKRSIGSYLYRKTYARAFFWLTGVMFVWQIFLPVLLIDTISCYQTNNQIGSDLAQICVNPREEITIEPQSSIHKVLFILQEDYHRHFSLTLNKKSSTDKLVFTF